MEGFEPYPKKTVLLRKVPKNSRTDLQENRHRQRLKVPSGKKGIAKYDDGMPFKDRQTTEEEGEDSF